LNTNQKHGLVLIFCVFCAQYNIQYWSFAVLLLLYFKASVSAIRLGYTSFSVLIALSLYFVLFVILCFAEYLINILNK